MPRSRCVCTIIFFWKEIREKQLTGNMNAGCQPKTFILMVKPLKPLFFSEKPLKTFILDDKLLFSGKAGGFFFSGEINSESVMLS